MVRVSRNADESYSLRFRRDRCLVQQDFDAVVVALPYNRLLEIEWAGERLRRAMTKHVACYNRPVTTCAYPSCSIDPSGDD